MLTSGRGGVELQPRDFALLRGLFDSRVMTLAHAAALYFAGKAEMAKKRVQRLKAAGLVRERPRRAYEPSVLFLTAPAFRVLSDHGLLSDYPRVGLTNLEKRAQVSDLTLRHELAVMDVKAAVVTAVAGLPHLRVVEFATWPLLYQFHASHPAPGGYGQTEVLLKPDGLVRIYEDAGGTFEHACYLEVDRSTESQDTLAQKAACYADHYRSGGFAARPGRPAGGLPAVPVPGAYGVPERRAAEQRGRAATAEPPAGPDPGLADDVHRGDGRPAGGGLGPTYRLPRGGPRHGVRPGADHGLTPLPLPPTAGTRIVGRAEPDSPEPDRSLTC